MRDGCRYRAAWSSVTTGNLAGIILARRSAPRHAQHETNIVSGVVELTALADSTIALDGGGLGPAASVYRLPEADFSRNLSLDHE